MGLTKEQQREKYRQQPEEKSMQGIKRLVNGKIVFLTKKQNAKFNKKKKKPPKIFYGHNTNK